MQKEKTTLPAVSVRCSEAWQAVAEKAAAVFLGRTA